MIANIGDSIILLCRFALGMPLTKIDDNCDASQGS